MMCPEPGCKGRIDAGYCNVCGLAPLPAGRQLGPETRIKTDKPVPEDKRFCGNPNCHEPVGRARDGQSGRTKGFCTHCGTAFSFEPKLFRGELVGGQYQVRGCLEHGGFGSIYLAIDTKLNDRRVVLKGLLNSGDQSALDAARAEVDALVKMTHPNIVQIYNFVEHDRGGNRDGYIVMEFVDGKSLKDIRKERYAPLPPAKAVKHIIEIAPALGFLHDQGRAYCDFKPDNVMQVDRRLKDFKPDNVMQVDGRLKLIDLGAVRAMKDKDRVFGTPGYHAPEVAETGPTVASDVYTVGRTLAVLVMDEPQQDGQLAEQLPGTSTVPILAKHESLYRAIVRATHRNPGQRFSSMEEFAYQLTGVLDEIVAVEGVTPQPRMSKCFSPQRAVYGSGWDIPVDAAHVVAALPVPVVDPDKPGAELLAIATTSGTRPAALDRALTRAQNDAQEGDRRPVEIELRLVRASLEVGAPKQARERLERLRSQIPGDWRLAWYSGQCALLQTKFDTAADEFSAVLAALPGELAPKMAIAATAELRDAPEDAARYYELVWRTDHNYVSAAFGLARQRARSGDRTGAVAVLDQVPTASAHFTAARAAAIEILIDGRTPENLDEQTLLDADERAYALLETEGRADRLPLESAAKRAAIRLRVLDAALAWLQAGKTLSGLQLLPGACDEPAIRTGMESAYRDRAREAADMWERIDLVERANAVRPRTRL